MKSTELLCLAVRHNIFGVGVITEVAGNHITVQFASKIARFLYPDSFEKFIVAVDLSVQAAIMAEISAAKQVAEEQRQAAKAALRAAEEQCAAERQDLPDRNTQKNIEDGFDPDYNVRHLSKQPILTYQQVEEKTSSALGLLALVVGLMKQNQQWF